MFRRSGWFLLFVIVAAATFVAEPKATARFTWDAFQAVGQFGGELVGELTAEGEEAGR